MHSIDPPDIDVLTEFVGKAHNCRALHISSEPVRDYLRDELVWEGRVEGFALSGHPTATAAYGWSAVVGGRVQHFSTLRGSGVEDPRDAVISVFRGRG